MYDLNNLNSSDLLSYLHDRPLKSEHRYKEDIYILEKAIILNPKSTHSILEWIASYHQLALLYINKGLFNKAYKCLFIPHQSMMYMANSNSDDSDLEKIANKAITITLPALLEFDKLNYPHG